MVVMLSNELSFFSISLSKAFCLMHRKTYAIAVGFCTKKESFIVWETGREVGEEEYVCV